MIEEIKITSLNGRGSVIIKSKDHEGYWLGPVDWGQVSGHHNTYSYYNQIGESIVSTTLTSRPISITGWVIDSWTGSLQERCHFLNSFISPAEDYILEYKDKKINFRPDSSIIYSRKFKKNNEIIRQFFIQGIAPYPLFTSIADQTSTFESSGKMFRFPTNFGRISPLVFANIKKAYNIEIYNSGGFQTGLIANIKFSGIVVNPRIINLTTGKFIGVNRTFSEGERLEISTAIGNKYITLRTESGEEENLIKYRDFQMTWMQLEPGSNVLALDCDKLDQRNNMEVIIKFTPLFLEVE